MRMPTFPELKPRYLWTATLIAASSITWPASASTEVDVGPYVPFVDARSAIVRVGTASPSTAELSIHPSTGGETVRLPASSGLRFHDFRVEGLQPATSYAYEISIDGIPTSGTLTTASTDPSRPWSFVLYGDSRTDDAAHAKVVESIVKLPSDFLLQTGDLVDHGEDQEAWKRFFHIERELLRSRALFVTVGNHDLTGRFTRTRKDFLRLFGSASARPYFSFRWGNARLYVLDAMDSWNGKQASWLRNTLEANKQEQGVAHRFVAIHHGPFSSGPHGPNERFVSAGFVDILREGGVDLILAGHDHIYERGDVGGLKYIVSGGAGAPLYDVSTPTNGSQRRSSVYHFVHIRVDGARVEAATSDAEGRLIERCGFAGGEGWTCDPNVSAPNPADMAAEHKRARCGCSTPGAGRAGLEWLVLPLFWAIRRIRDARTTTAS